jgi:hypothetical protein
MEMDQATIPSFDTAESSLRVQLADAAVQRLCMEFDVLPPLTFVVLELPAGRPEGVADSDVGVLVRMVRGVRSSDRNLAARHGNVKMKFEQRPLFAMLRGASMTTWQRMMCALNRSKRDASSWMRASSAGEGSICLKVICTGNVIVQA